ncbi:hypothetical protein D3C81_1518030 [compost metagenome]
MPPQFQHFGAADIARFQQRQVHFEFFLDQLHGAFQRAHFRLHGALALAEQGQLVGAEFGKRLQFGREFRRSAKHLCLQARHGRLQAGRLGRAFQVARLGARAVEARQQFALFHDAAFVYAQFGQHAAVGHLDDLVARTGDHLAVGARHLVQFRP